MDPTTGVIGGTLTYSTIASDPDGDKIRYCWDFNNDNIVDEWSILLESNTTCRISYNWGKAGVYHIKVKAVYKNGAEGNWSTNLTAVTISNPSNNPPSKPIITGSTKGRIQARYEYTFKSIDPDGDDIYHFV